MNFDNPDGSSSIQPIYLAQAEVFIFEEDKTKGWLPLETKSVPTSIVYDATRGIYRIISVNSQYHKVIVNSTICPDLEFHKTSETFGHWTDQSTGTIYGIGFSSEFEQIKFIEVLTNSKNAMVMKPITVEPSLGPFDRSCKSLNSQDRKNMPPSGGIDCYEYALSESHKLPSWNGSESLVQNLGVLLNKVENNPEEIEFIMAPGAHRRNGCGDQNKADSIEALRVKPPQSQLRLLVPDPDNKGLGKRPGTYVSRDKQYDSQSIPDHGENLNMSDQVKSIKGDNLNMKKVLYESTETVKRWEIELDKLRAKNAYLVRKVEELADNLEEDKKTVLTMQEECDRLKNHGVCNSSKLEGYKDLELKLEKFNEEKRKLEGLIVELSVDKNESSSFSSIDSMSQMQLDFSKEAAEMEGHYKRLLDSMQRQLDETMRVNREGKATVDQAGPIFSKTIHELIGIHNRLRKAYQSQTQRQMNEGHTSFQPNHVDGLSSRLSGRNSNQFSPYRSL